MKKVYVFENNEVLNLEPIVLTRPAFDLRCGSSTFLERIKHFFPKADIELFVRNELQELTQELHPDHIVNPSEVEEGLWILGNVFWTDKDIKKISKTDYKFYYSDKVLSAAYLRKDIANNWIKMGGPVKDKILACPTISEIESKIIRYLWDVIENIGDSLTVDIKNFKVTKYQTDGVNIIEGENVSVASPDLIKPNVVIDASKGPVIIAENVEIFSHSVLQGPLYIGEGSVVQPHSFVRNSIIGPVCKIGGEISSSIIQGYSNKVHYGFLGNAYIGQWVNFGAGTTNSNLKNNYTPVQITVNNKVVKTEELFLGLFAGDYSAFAIGTTLNTGTNIGPGCNIVTSGFPPKHIRPFTWYLNGKHIKTSEAKFLKSAEVMQNRRGKSVSEAEKYVLLNILNKQ